MLLTTLAFAFGGFFFYAGVVVPIGSSVLDTTTQGFVTRHVTKVINLGVAVTLVFLIWDYFACKLARSKLSNRLWQMGVLGIGTTWLFLVYLHPELERLLVPDSFSVVDADRFYLLHRLYLWASTLQWLAVLPIVWVLAKEMTGNVIPLENLNANDS